MTALLASNWVTSSAVTWISVGVTILVILTLGFVYKDRLESWMFGARVAYRHATT